MVAQLRRLYLHQLPVDTQNILHEVEVPIILHNAIGTFNPQRLKRSNHTEYLSSRRSQSPPPRGGNANYRPPASYANDSLPNAPYPSGGTSYGAQAAGYSGNVYGSGPPVPVRNGSGARERDYPPRNGADAGNAYSRRV